ncbi:MAG: HAMP domain-containing histidine kinase [Oscillospiraceae bacterium]|nr:HAMP domain-containing histidine kinase [Oscillospiraceae bacterium]
MKKHRTPTTRALMLRIWALALSLWLAAMSYLTIMVALDITAQNEAHLVKYSTHYSFRDDTASQHLRMLETITSLDVFGDTNTSLPLVEDPFANMEQRDRVLHGLCEQYDTAMIFLDADGNELFTGGPYATVQYQDEFTWFSGSDDLTGTTYIDLTESGLEGSAPSIYAHRLQDVHYIDQQRRYTGYFTDDRFVVLAIHTLVPIKQVHNPENYTYGQLDRLGRLEWEADFDNTETTDRELIRIYPGSVTALTTHTEPVTAQGTRYDTLEDLLRYQLQQNEDYTSDSLLDSVTVRVRTYTDAQGRPCRYAVALHTWPVRTAMLRLLQFYAVTLIPVVMIVLLLWWDLHQQLHRPLTQLLRCAQDGLAPLEETAHPHWKEPHDLEQLYVQLQQRLRQLEAEKNQLTTKLDYAKDAEKHRRRLISGITHQLKTPLTVIHSYAEGLCEDIAADKREQYTRVIQEEVEQMDSMVLQMLDLSRLESGKVKLELSSFSLLRLTQSIQEKLEVLLQEKSLQLQYSPAEDFQIYADEARICQVITELLSNAIKHSPEGTSIVLGIYRHKGATYLDIENRCPPLTQEELSKLWDSFYRGDNARATAGTGLGLTIVKTIVSLHGGTCTAQTTPTGLKFHITLP